MLGEITKGLQQQQPVESKSDNVQSFYLSNAQNFYTGTFYDGKDITSPQTICEVESKIKSMKEMIAATL